MKQDRHSPSMNMSKIKADCCKSLLKSQEYVTVDIFRMIRPFDKSLSGSELVENIFSL